MTISEEERIEAAAVAITREYPMFMDLKGKPGNKARLLARAAIQAYLNGDVVVPREPTDAMMKSGYEAIYDNHFDGTQAVMIGAFWDAMIRATATE